MNKQDGFPIIQPPKSRRWVNVSGTVNGMSYLIGLGILLGTFRISLGGGRALHQHTPPHPELLMPGMLVSALFFLIPLGIQFYRRRVPVTKRFPDVGIFFLQDDHVRICMEGEAELIIPFDQIYRMDMYHYKGIAPQTSPGSNTFEEILTIRMAITLLGGKEHMLYLQNNTLGKENTGELYYRLIEIKRMNTTLWRKIQFWEQF